MPHRDRVFKVLFRALACVFLTYHLAASTLTNLTTSTALRSQPHRWIRPYISLFSLWQEWDMFTTIPYYLEIRGTLVGTFSDQTTREFGPMLPDFEETPRSLKITSLLARLMWSKNAFESNVSRWEHAACRAIADETGQRPKTIHLKLSTERLNPLARVRSTGEISHPEQFNTRPASCKP